MPERARPPVHHTPLRLRVAPRQDLREDVIAVLHGFHPGVEHLVGAIVEPRPQTAAAGARRLAPGLGLHSRLPTRRLPAWRQDGRPMGPTARSDDQGRGVAQQAVHIEAREHIQNRLAHKCGAIRVLLAARPPQLRVPAVAPQIRTEAQACVNELGRDAKRSNTSLAATSRPAELVVEATAAAASLNQTSEPFDTGAARECPPGRPEPSPPCPAGATAAAGRAPAGTSTRAMPPSPNGDLEAHRA
eukprot:CAMPEP_0177545910 /NCGR_PEP_ID=MMETSP0369-20130122/62905_1 /TAXON_ID=447022 ORGANISM="Scrippsiella hangoei-like, Strain SHHI-4" /NCGR_SAMPLE_ID=MMETSP0369 /ASSEMBLY_ACC=CAM_ASM_000364 /LENGTH=244 /DNA_ID=CAMNT_0019030305 /DNA_START=150 /DNA_END=882 /DNA_ORIENTATION=+